jgi:hypothetical protein
MRKMQCIRLDEGLLGKLRERVGVLADEGLLVVADNIMPHLHIVNNLIAMY